MPVNSRLMLSDLSLGMREMAELLEAEQPELDLLRQHAEEIKRECNVNTARATIPRYEQIFALAAGSKTLEERRATILLYMNAHTVITPRYMEELLAGVLDCECELEEFFSEYRFNVNIQGKDHAPNMAEAARYVKMLKPAHLEANLRYQQKEKGTMQMAVRAGFGLYLKVRPYQPEDVRAEGSIRMGLFLRGAQRLQIHPKGGI